MYPNPNSSNNLFLVGIPWLMSSIIYIRIELPGLAPYVRVLKSVSISQNFLGQNLG